MLVNKRLLLNKGYDVVCYDGNENDPIEYFWRLAKHGECIEFQPGLPSHTEDEAWISASEHFARSEPIK